MFQPLDAVWGLGAAFQSKLIASVIGIILVLVLRSAAMRLLNRQVLDPTRRYRWRKGISYASFAIALLLGAGPWLPNLRGLSTFLGIITAGLAVALRDPIINLAGWMFLLWRRPFQVGDRIQIGDYAGDVIDIRVFQFTLMEIGNWVAGDQSTGRIIHIPNGSVFRDAIANYSKGFRYLWNEIPVLITFESDWEKAKDILIDIANQHAEYLSNEAQAHLRQAVQRYLIFYSKLTPTVYTSVRESGVLLTIRYLCEPRRRRGTEQSIWESVLRAFAQHGDIKFAYPTQRFYQAPTSAEAPTPIKDYGVSER